MNWKKPAVTGGILASINLFFLAMFMSGMSLFTISTYFFLFYVVAGIVVVQFSEKPENE
jgi:TctA family transporter